MIHGRPHPEEPRPSDTLGVNSTRRLEGWATTRAYPTLRDGPTGLLRVKSGCISVQGKEVLARIEYVEAVASRPLIVTGDNAIADGVSPALGVSPSLPSGVLRRKWPNSLRALLREMKVTLWANTYLTA